jgi:hypothetical protein
MKQIFLALLAMIVVSVGAGWAAPARPVYVPPDRPTVPPEATDGRAAAFIEVDHSLLFEALEQLSPQILDVEIVQPATK